MEKDRDESSEKQSLCINSNKLDDSVKDNLIEEQLNGFDTPIIRKYSFRHIFPQIIVGCIAHCIVIQVGINMAYSTILEDGLKKEFSLTIDQISWIASLVTISVPLGSLIVGPLMDLFGRKKICLISCIINIVSSIILVLANSVTLIYIARVTAGFSSGLSSVSIVYISEITHPQIRPMLLCFNSVFVSLGILITYCFGIWLTWNQMAIAFILLNSCVLFILLFIPESPYWLMYFGKKELTGHINQIENILRLLNKSEEMYREELRRISAISEKQHTDNELKSSITRRLLYFYEQLKHPTVYKPSIILFTLFLIQQLTGSYVIIFYALSVFENVGGKFGNGLDKYGAMVILGVIRFLLSIIASLFSKKFGRRTLCIISSLGMAFSMFFSGMYIYLTSSYDENGKLKEIMVKQNWVILIIILFYVSTSCFGFTIIPWTLIGELLPISVRGVLGGIMISIAYIMMFGMIKGYVYMMDEMGAQGTFFFFSAASFIGAVFVYIFLPETLGKSFSEIEQYFSKDGEEELPTERINT
ncbi:PREDICTED: facilitated trehalose transporter Tret1-like [Ceratosolen solmsi marchali]|uniref:Facilitated trehalose transporter Tret1-like n=1 Tax=Ceratosolen solmsi marchali TaxID=326594 RepID=A0AAJ6VLH8_9HYME|nr:PREDICTED: facilitated trehalose transporter Tret1-like [Ceratosolen solmsi marchali]XP_011494574.1 PREDICTED: facilitated trehalose transporter Tret1-like [Ceratosolen solmsi marchali]